MTIAEMLLAISLSFCGQTTAVQEALEKYGDPIEQAQYPEHGGMVIIWDVGDGVNYRLMQTRRFEIESCESFERIIPYDNN